MITSTFSKFQLILLHPNSDELAEHFIPRLGINQLPRPQFQLESFNNQTLWIGHPRIISRAMDSQSPIEMSCIHSHENDQIFFIKCSYYWDCSPIWNVQNVTEEICHGIWKTSFILENDVDISKKLMFCTKTFFDELKNETEIFYSLYEHPLIFEKTQEPGSDWSQWSSWSSCQSNQSLVTRNRTQVGNETAIQHKYCQCCKPESG